jgi:hypothetical protein
MSLIGGTDESAHCADPIYPPDMWFPEPERGAGNGEPNRLMVLRAVEALEICAGCPLMANGKCLEYAMSDTTTIDYGIYAGTLPMERRHACGTTNTNEGSRYQHLIRSAANKRGLTTPHIPERERPKPSYQEYFTHVSAQ